MPNHPPLIQQGFIKLLYRACGHYALLPSVLDYRGQDVAVKVIRTYSNRELRGVINVGCWPCFVCAYYALIILLYAEVLQGSCDVEIPPASQHLATARSNDDRDPIRDGISLDGKWKYQ